ALHLGKLVDERADALLLRAAQRHRDRLAPLARGEALGGLALVHVSSMSAYAKGISIRWPAVLETRSCGGRRVERSDFPPPSATPRFKNGGRRSMGISRRRRPPDLALHV